MSKTNRKKDIAVIGMSGVFPKSDNLSVFWNNLINGKELIQFYEDKELDPELLKLPNYIPCGSFIDHSDSFDYQFFGYTKAEAALMDPQIRIMHEQVYASLDNAGYSHRLEKDRVGLYLSASDNINWRLMELFYVESKVSKFLAQRLSNKEFISTLISYKLGLTGPSFYIDTACSGSLSNIHLACRALLLKECNIAVSGGVSIQSSEGKGYLYKEGFINSKDGHCRTFDADSSGTLWGEGAGAVVLKRFEDAIQDNDYIYAVIKATAVNNDGKRKVGYTAPSVKGQSECIKMAHKIAGIQPEEISYIEAHGTATELGDPIEIEALNEAFNYNTDHQCAIGSAKTNMGHLDSAAGIAGFIKTCLCLNFRMIPPSLHFKAPNPNINFNKGPFYVNSNLKKWDRDEIFRAGVSSFGIGGTNCHAVLEEYKEETLISEKQRPSSLVLLSAKTNNALGNYKSKIAAFVGEQKDCNLAQLSYSINNKAQNFPCKDFIVFNDREEALAKLNATHQEVIPKKYKNVFFLFPGQGTQYVEMAQELYLELPLFKKILDEGFKILEGLTGINYKKIIGYEQGNADPDLINNTLYAQALLFLIEYALAKTLISFGIVPTCMIGHSLGEYTAACVSNVFTLEDGLKIICTRASLMSKMEAGSMIAVKAKAEDVLKLTENDLNIAAINTLNTCVLTGKSEYIESLATKLAEKEISHAILKTSHAFHSYMMDDLLKPFEEALKQFEFLKPEIPFISNLTGEAIGEEELSAAYWAKHVRSTVLFQKGLSQILEKWPSDDNIFIEVGPGRVLLNFLKRNSSQTQLTLATIRSVKEKKSDYKSLLDSLGILWKAGQQLNVSSLYDKQLKKLPLPTYAFDRTRLPAKVNPLKLIQANLNPETDAESLLSNISLGTFFDDNESSATVVEGQQVSSFRLNLPTEYAPPENKTQMKLCAIWKTFLGDELIGIDDNFFELGGDSLKAMSILNAIKKEFNCEVKVQELYDSPTIKTISSNIDITTQLKKITKKVTQKNKLKI